MTKTSGAPDPPAVSIVIPAYREGLRLATSLQRVLEMCSAHYETAEVIAVIDGPDTRTIEALDAVRRDARVRVLINARNRGKGYSVRRGVLEAAGQVVLFTDADLSLPIETAPVMVEALREGADVAIASRALGASEGPHVQALGRRTMSRVFNALVQATLLPGLRDTQCGLKAFRRDAARRLFAVQRIDRFAFDVEILWLARRWGLRIVEVPVACVYYSHSSVRRSVDSLSMVRDLARIGFNSMTGRYGDLGATARDGGGRNQAAG